MTRRPAKSPTSSSVPQDTSVGGFVRTRRQANGMTLRELADLAGVGVRFLLELEHDKPTLRLDAVNRVLGVFGKQLGVVDRKRE